MKKLESYLERFAKLHSDSSRSRWPATTHYRAPHKPVILLAVMDLIAEGTVSANLIEVTPDLGEMFTLYWSRVMPPDQRGNLALPFFHLKSDGFWHLMPQPGKETIVEGSDQIKSVHRLRELILGARLDEELYQLLQNDRSREQLRALLIEKYFSPELHPGLLEQGIINIEAYRYSQNLLEQARKQKDSEALSVGQPMRPAARDQGFRRAVVTAYEHRCAVCGIRMMTADGLTIVDAAHIKPWSISFNDNPRNGVALCKLCHWTFDEGMITVTAKYTVLTSPQIASNHNLPGHVLTLNSRPIICPEEQSLCPDLEALIWHKQNVFRHR
jgi:putative restriction endonuclease